MLHSYILLIAKALDQTMYINRLHTSCGTGYPACVLIILLIEPGIIFRTLGQPRRHRVVPDIVPFFQKFRLIPDNAVIALILPEGPWAPLPRLIFQALKPLTLCRISPKSTVAPSSRGKGLTRACTWSGKTTAAYTTHFLPSQNCNAFDIALHGGQTLALLTPPGNKIDAPRLLPVGKPAPGNFKGAHRLKACATGFLRFITRL
jgi:hypothetical protein